MVSNNDLGVILSIVTTGLPVLPAAVLIWRGPTPETGAYLHAQVLVPEPERLSAPFEGCARGAPSAAYTAAARGGSSDGCSPSSCGWC
jgi:hypothetical protein